MKQKIYVMLALLGLLGVGRVSAQVVTVQNTITATTFNLQSVTGVPITSTVNTNIGSNGKMVVSTNTTDAAYNLPPTTNQFASVFSYGGGVGVTTANGFTTNAAGVLVNDGFTTNTVNGTTAFSGLVAQAMRLPVGTSNGVVVIIAKSVQIGAPYYSSPVTYDFGSIIRPPLTDEKGVLLTNTQASYWQQVPRSASNGTNDQYYYSPNAGVVFATQPGQVPITWITTKSYPLGTTLPNYVNPGGSPSFYTNGGNVYPLYTAYYIVTGVPVKPAQNMYWTEGSYSSVGHAVPVASGRINAINVLFNTAFPETVATPYVDPYSTVVTNGLQETRTLWFDSSLKLIRAYNAQGQVFVELLGTPNGADNNAQFLGFEIEGICKKRILDSKNKLGSDLMMAWFNPKFKSSS